MADFDKAYSQVAAQAEGYVDEEGRRGELYCGISRRFHPHWRGWRRIDAARRRTGFPANLDRDRYLPAMVERFHKQQYWDRVAGDRLPDQALAAALYHSALVVGARRTVRMLQQSLNMLSPEGHAGVTVDGLPGDGTLRALRAHLRRMRGAAALLQVISLLRGGQDTTGVMPGGPRRETAALG